MKPERKLRLLLVDDHAVIRMGLTGSLNLEPDLTVIGEAGKGGQAIELHRKLRPDVVLMDFRLPDMTGVEATKTICREFPDARVLMLTVHEGEEDVYQAMQAGALGYVQKSIGWRELLAAIRSVAAGERYLPPELAARLKERLSREALSERELEVLHLIVRGQSNKEIGVSLNISDVTVKRHITHILEKLHVLDRTQAAIAAIQRGIVHLD
ncbi:MAG: response regulator transcription factor [Verrucomicrobia bacterium]|nr:response regulator transcription factor [Verrucomicrobiota bacterium]